MSANYASASTHRDREAHSGKEAPQRWSIVVRPNKSGMPQTREERSQERRSWQRARPPTTSKTGRHPGPKAESRRTEPAYMPCPAQSGERRWPPIVVAAAGGGGAGRRGTTLWVMGRNHEGRSARRER